MHRPSPPLHATGPIVQPGKTPTSPDALHRLTNCVPGPAEVPWRIREIAMLRGLGYSYREIARPLGVTPQAVALMLSRHRRSIKSLRSAMQLSALSPRAVNALGRHGIRTREQARRCDLLERLAGERNCGRKTLDEIARWISEDGVNGSNSHGAAAAEALSQGGGAGS
jgi:predicted transcriptional regulator